MQCILGIQSWHDNAGVLPQGMENAVWRVHTYTRDVPALMTPQPRVSMTASSATVKDSRTAYASFAAVVLLGILARFYLLRLHQVIDYDGVFYAMLGKNFVAGLGYTEPAQGHQWYYPPLYPLSVGIFWRAIGNLELCSKLVSLIFGVGIMALVYRLAKRLYGARAALFAVGLTALHPDLISFSSTDSAESMFTFIFVLAILSAVGAVRSAKLRRYFVTGVLFGLLFMAKPAGVQYFAAFICFLAVITVLEKQSLRSLLARVMVMVVVFGVISYPYLDRLRDHYGRWTLSELPTLSIVRSTLAFSGDNPEKVFQLNEAGTHLRYWTSIDNVGERVGLVALFRQAPRAFIRRYVSNAVQELRQILCSFRVCAALIVILLAAHVASFMRRRIEHTTELLLLCLLLPLATDPLFSAASPRRVLPLMPILLIWAASGMAEIQRGLTNRFGAAAAAIGRHAVTVEYRVIDDHFLGAARSQGDMLDCLDTVAHGARLIKKLTYSNGKATALWHLPEADGRVQPVSKVVKIAGGYEYTEGPASEGEGSVLFCNYPDDAIVRLLADGSTRDVMTPSGKANGLVFDDAGYLYACQRGARRMA